MSALWAVKPEPTLTVTVTYVSYACTPPMCALWAVTPEPTLTVTVTYDRFIGAWNGV